MRNYIVGAALAMAGALGCGSDYQIADQTLEGQVGGSSWSFVAGHTDAFLSEDDDDFFALLHAESYTPCELGSPSGPHLIVAVPKEPGEYDFSLSLNMTFVPSSGENLIATEGVIRVDEVTATSVTGGLHGVFDGDNEVSGTFQLTVCDDTQ